MSNKENRRKARMERAAELRRQEEKRQRNRKIAIVGAVAAVLVIVIGIGWLVQSQRDSTGESAAAPEGATDEYGLVVGPDDADSTVVVYEDFLCPACAAFEQVTVAEFERMTDEGTLQVEYRPFELLDQTDYSKRATNAFAVVLDEHGPEVAKDFHDLLFANQPQEAGSPPDDDWLVEQAEEAGADAEQVRGPIEDMAFEGWVENATDHASQDGVRATPTVRVDGEDVEGQSMQELIDNTMAAINGGG